MSLPKLFERIFWHNNTTPAINEDNLNAMSKGLSDVDDRLISLGGLIMETVPEIQQDMEILGPAVESIDDNVAAAQASAETAEEQALKSEGFAVGEQDGVPVGSDSEYFENNAEYFANIANPPIRVIKDFAPIISITDAINKKARDVRIKVEPVQDMHGYHNPWVGGAGKNKLPFDLATMKSINTLGTWNGNAYTLAGITFTVGDNTITANGTADANTNPGIRIIQAFTLPVGNYVLSGGEDSAANKYKIEGYIPQTGGTAKYPNDISDSSSSFSIDSNSGNAVFYIEVYRGYTVSNQVFRPMIRPSGTSADFEPYENICPITGWDNAKVTRSGKNLLPFDLATIKALNTSGTWNGNVYTKNGITTTVNSNGTLLLNGTATADVTITLAYDIEMLHDSILSGCPSGGAISNYFLAFEKKTNPWTRYATDVGEGATITVRTVDDNVVYFRVRSGQTVSNLLIKPMIRDASITDATYEPYQGEEITIDLGGTRYGGTLDVDTGTLTPDRVYEEKTLASIYQRSGNANCDFALFTVTETLPSNIYTSTQVILDKGRYYNNSAETFDNISQYGVVAIYSLGNKTLAISVPKGASLADAQSMFGTIGIVYPLATPQTIQLTATEVYLLYGYNTLFGDCGDISLTYDASGIIHIADKKLDIDVFKAVTAASSDFADFKTRVAAL